MCRRTAETVTCCEVGDGDEVQLGQRVGNAERALVGRQDPRRQPQRRQQVLRPARKQVRGLGEMLQPVQQIATFQRSREQSIDSSKAALILSVSPDHDSQDTTLWSWPLQSTSCESCVIHRPLVNGHW